MEKALDIGGGTEPFSKEGTKVIHMDLCANKSVKGTIFHNAEHIPYPFKDNEFDIVYASMILEHIRNLWKWEIDGNCVIDEISRILKPKGRFIIRMPHMSVAQNYGHPTHCRFVALNHFNFLENKVESYCNSEWKILKKEIRYNRLGIIGKIITKIANKNERTQWIFERFLLYYLGGFDECYFELQKEGV